MYFIVKGKFAAYIKSDGLSKQASFELEKEHLTPTTFLYDGGHFGEIGMLFDCKRTATVESQGYGQLALLRKSAYTELTKTFENMTMAWKQQIFKYNDEVTNFIALELEKIRYFRNLSLQTK